MVEELLDWLDAGRLDVEGTLEVEGTKDVVEELLEGADDDGTEFVVGEAEPGLFASPVSDSSSWPVGRGHAYLVTVRSWKAVE